MNVLRCPGHRLLALVAFALPSALFAQPSIKPGGIVNVSGYQAVLAPGTVFVIFGSAMGPASIAIGPGPNYPLSLSGTSITFTPVSGGPVINAKMVYTLAAQVAGLLPSSIAPGTYAVRVTYLTQSSAPQNVAVVARSFGIATANSSGTGTAQSTVGNVNGGLSLTRFTPGSVAFGGYTWTLTPAHPGDTLVLWGTGGGADPLNDTGGTSGDQTAAGSFIVNVGSAHIKPLFAGAASGFPGLWQINFVLPPDITPDCFARVQVSAGGEIGNAASLPIAAAGQSTCSTPGFTAAALSKLDAGGNIAFAGMTIGKLTFTATPPSAPLVQELVGGPFSSFTAAEWTLPFSGPKIGPCNVLDVTYPASGKDPSTADAFLDAGPKLSLSGPGVLPGVGAGQIMGLGGPVYSATLPNGTLVDGGTYTLSDTGGSQVGAFTASATLPTGFAVTNWDFVASIDRTQPLSLTWTGAGFDQIVIRAQSAVLTPATTHNVTVTCTVPASSGSYSVPPGALAYLLPTAGSASNVGQLSVTTALAGGTVTAVSSSAQTFTPPLTAGGNFDFGSFSPFVSAIKSVAIQ